MMISDKKKEFQEGDKGQREIERWRDRKRDGTERDRERERNEGK